MSQMTTQPAASERRGAMLAMNVCLVLTGLVALATLVLEYGGLGLSDTHRHWLHAAQVAVAALFVLDRFARALLSGRASQYIKSNWVDFGLMPLAAIAAVASITLRAGGLLAGTICLVVVQIYIVVVLLLRGVGAALLAAQSRLHPTWLLIGSFLVLCFAGSGLLMLPAASHEITPKPLFYIDALFTSVSAVCVTGLTVRDTGADFTPMGQSVIVGLIQLGGLGVMLYGTVLAMLIGKGLPMRRPAGVGEVSASERFSEISRMVSLVVVVTFAVELVGAILLYPMFAACPESNYSTAEAAWYSVFHSVSAFCNAGFSLYTNNLMQGVREGWGTNVRDHWQVLGVLAPLIVAGGLGFPVLREMAQFVRHGLGRLVRGLGGRSSAASTPHCLSLHAKLVLSTSALLIVLGAAGIALFEPVHKEGDRVRGAFGAKNQGEAKRLENDWAGLGANGRTREALFQSVSARTTGFNTVDIGALSNATKLWMSLLMIIGASPAGTGGGMKTITFAILILAMLSVLRRRSDADAFHRSLPNDVVRKSMALAMLYLGLVAAITLWVSVTMDPHENFIDVLFETCSACGSVGLSAGLTPRLTDGAKMAIMVGMFVGRLGPMTLLAVLAMRSRHVEDACPTEDVVLG